MRSLVQLLAVIAAFGTGAIVRAQDEAQVQDWPRFHIGVGVGQSHVGPADWDSFGLAELVKPNQSVDNSTTGLKFVAGFRPIRVVGAELQLVDFGEVEIRSGGSPHFRAQYGYYSLNSEANATMLSALLFIPHASPSWDVYGKVGVAKLDESFDVQVVERSLECLAPGGGYLPSCTFFSQVDETASHPSVGIGARIKIAREWAVRVEYEAIDDDVGDPTTMLSLGFAWESFSLSRGRGRP